MDFRSAVVNRLVIALLVLQAASNVLLLTLNAFNAASEAQFMILLGVNLIALDMVIYVYLSNKLGSTVKLKWMAGGGLMITLFLSIAILLR